MAASSNSVNRDFASWICQDDINSFVCLNAQAAALTVADSVEGLRAGAAAASIA